MTDEVNIYIKISMIGHHLQCDSFYFTVWGIILLICCVWFVWLASLKSQICAWCDVGNMVINYERMRNEEENWAENVLLIFSLNYSWPITTLQLVLLYHTAANNLGRWRLSCAITWHKKASFQTAAHSTSGGRWSWLANAAVIDRGERVCPSLLIFWTPGHRWLWLRWMILYCATQEP